MQDRRSVRSKWFCRNIFIFVKWSTSALFSEWQKIWIFAFYSSAFPETELRCFYLNKYYFYQSTFHVHKHSMLLQNLNILHPQVKNDCISALMKGIKNARVKLMEKKILVYSLVRGHRRCRGDECGPRVIAGWCSGTIRNNHNHKNSKNPSAFTF